MFVGYRLFLMYVVFLVFFVKQKTAYVMRIGDWSSDVCSSDLGFGAIQAAQFVGYQVHGRDVADVLAARRAAGDGRAVLVRQAVGAHPGLVVHQRVQRDAVPPRDLVVVEVVRAGDLDRARAELREIGRAHV